MATLDVQKSLDYFRIAWQSALGASLCLGLPAGLLFWLILLDRLNPSHALHILVTVLQDHGVLEIIGTLVGAFGWGIILSKISGYHRGWLLVTASILGAYVGRRLFWVIHDWVNPDFSNQPDYMVLAIYLSGQVLSVTLCTGLAHGIILRNWKAALMLAGSTSFVSVLAAVTTMLILDQFGIRVGTGNAAMSKVTATSTMISAITGGMVLGTIFSWYVREESI